MDPTTPLHRVLTRAQELGFLGPGPVDPHVEHAGRFAGALAEAAGDGAERAPADALDLGSGGGLPGLVLAGRWPASRWVYLDANERRTAFLTEAVTELALADRAAVRRGRAEELGRVPELRGRFDLVTARGFGSPAVTAECAAPFLRVGGYLVVSEPPDESNRWDRDGLALVGLDPLGRFQGCQVLRQRTACPDRYPRRVGIPSKRPLFASRPPSAEPPPAVT